MKIIRLKSFVALLIILFVIAFSTSATSLIGFPGVAPVEHYATTETPGEVNPLAVVYPDNLQDSRNHTTEYIKAFSKKEREYIIHIFSKGTNFFPKAIQVLDKYEVPLELQMIPVLESEFNANAVSRAGAVGYWQFMTELAKEYGLHTGGKYDERRNFSKSTVAAAKFFRDQLDFFNDDLLLSVAAYNCGQGRIRCSLKKCGKADATYWDIKRYLPAETRKFVMNFIALNVISSNYEKFLNNELNFNEPPILQEAPLDSTNTQDSLSAMTL